MRNKTDHKINRMVYCSLRQRGLPPERREKLARELGLDELLPKDNDRTSVEY